MSSSDKEDSETLLRSKAAKQSGTQQAEANDSDVLIPDSFSDTPVPNSPSVQMSPLSKLNETDEEESLRKLLEKMYSDIEKYESEKAALEKAAAVKTNRLWWSVFATNFATFALFVMLYLGRWNYNINKLSRHDITDYHYDESFFDMFIIVCFRFVLVLVGLAVSVKSENITGLMYWGTFFSLILGICKAVVIEHYRPDSLVALCIITIACELVCFATVHVYVPPSDDSSWDPYAEEDERVRKARVDANEEASERAKALSLTLTGEELQKHNKKEEFRVKSFEYVEKKDELTKLHRHDNDIKWSEVKMLMRPYFIPASLFAKFIVISTWVIVAGSKLCSILAPLYIGKAADQIINEQTVPYHHICVFTLLNFLSLALKQAQSAVYLKVKMNAFLELSQLVFEHLVGQSISFHLSRKLGSTLRVQDRGIMAMDQINNYLLLYIFPSLVEACAVFFIFYFKFDVPVLSSVVLFHLTAYIVVTVTITQYRKQYRAKAVVNDNRLHSIASETLLAIETIKSSGNEQFQIDQYIAAVKDHQQSSIATQASLSLLNSIQGLVIQSCLMLSLLAAAYEITKGKLTIGDFSSVSYYVSSVFAPLSFLGTIYDMVIQSLVDMKQLTQLLRVQPDVKDAPDAYPVMLQDGRKGAKIQFKHVQFNYNEQGKGLQDIDFTVERGTTTALVGSTGSGKSTIVKLLLRYYDTTKGDICIDDQPINEITQKSLRSAEVLALVPQHTLLFNNTVLFNVRYGRPDATFEEVRQACKAAEILDFIENLPAQFNTIVGERGLRQSGGECQRIAIARAILRNPAICILDEATSALDSSTERKIQTALNILQKERTNIIIAHRLSTITHAEQILVLEKGRIIERGTHTQLLNMHGKYAELWYKQSTSSEDQHAE